MIILEELDEETKTEERPDRLQRRETLLPPYSPRKTLRISSNGAAQTQYGRQILPNDSLGLNPSFAQHRPAHRPPPLPPHTRRVPGSPSPSFATFASSLSNSSGSSQTLSIPPRYASHDGLPTPPSASSFASSSRTAHASTASLATGSGSSSVVLPLPPYRTRPPPHAKAANYIRIERGVGAINGSFLVDPALSVPSFLLPETDTAYIDDMQEHAAGVGAGAGAGSGDRDLSRRQNSGASSVGSGSGDTRRARQRQRRRPNILLETDTGDISVDIWIREGSYAHGRRRRRWKWNLGYVDAEDEAYWESDWTLPAGRPWPQKTEETVDVDVRSRSGNVNVRIHAQSHLRLRLRISSADGSTYVGIPHYFYGFITVSPFSESDPQHALSRLMQRGRGENGSQTDLPAYLHNSPSIPVLGKELSIPSNPLPSLPSSLTLASSTLVPRSSHSSHTPHFHSSHGYGESLALPAKRHRRLLSRGGSVSGAGSTATRSDRETDTYDADDACSSSSEPSFAAAAAAAVELMSLGMQAMAMLPKPKPKPKPGRSLTTATGGALPAIQFSALIGARAHGVPAAQTHTQFGAGAGFTGATRYAVGAPPADLLKNATGLAHDELSISAGGTGAGTVTVAYNDEAPMARQDGLLRKIGWKWAVP